MSTQEIADLNNAVEAPAVQCPCCAPYVESDPERVQCPCGFQFRWRGTVLDWGTQPDTFYEGRCATEIHFDKRRLQRPGGRLLLHFLIYGYYEAILRSVPAGGRILDIGCAGGSKLLAEWGRVTGLDLSLRALEVAASKYAWGVRANACRVDFAPATFHAIVSCFFWEHMRPPDKDLLLERSSRWLRPGREVVLLFDVASRNPLLTRARRHPCESC